MDVLLNSGTFVPFKLLNNPLATYSEISIKLLLHTEPFDKSNILPFLVLTTFECLFSVFFHS